MLFIYKFCTKDIREFDQFLGPYPLVPQDQESLNVYHRWLTLTSKINKKVIKLILPEDGKLSAINSISHFSEVNEETDQNKNDNNKEDEDTVMASSSTTGVDINVDKKDSKVDQEKYRLNFTVINLKKSYPDHASSEEITKYSIDKSYLLKKIIEKDYKGNIIIKIFYI